MSKTQNEATNRQVLALQNTFGKAISRYMPTTEQADHLIGDNGDPTPIYEFVAKLFDQPADIPAYRQVKREWSKIYRKYFNFKLDFSNIFIPAYYNPDEYFVVIVAKGVTMNQAVVAMRKNFKVSLYTEDLDASVIKNDRVADKDYCILFRKNIEADEDLKNLSANDMLERSHIKCITLLERLLLEIYYFNKTNKHLDVDNVTLCSGSRHSDGYVPSVDFDSADDEVRVDWYDPIDARGILRSRAAFVD